jgi:shikimate dehydrogenase
MPARDLATRVRVHETTARSAVYGIAGRPLAHSASPAMHNAALACAGMDAVYLPFETADPAELLDVADALGVRGLSVTAPLKEALLPHLASVSARAAAIGAVNTLRRDATGWHGENFDIDGFLAPLEAHRARLDGGRAVVLGAGGAARAVVLALQSIGMRVAISARRDRAADALATALGVDAVAWPPDADCDLLVNATSCGTWPDVDAAPIDRGLVPDGIVYDLVYNPALTTLLRWASAGGAPAIGGLPMLAAQAERQFAWWTGAAAPPGVMTRAARAFVEEMTQ